MIHRPFLISFYFYVFSFLYSIEISVSTAVTMVPAPESNGHTNGSSTEHAKGTITTLPGPNHNWSIGLSDKVIASKSSTIG